MSLKEGFYESTLQLYDDRRLSRAAGGSGLRGLLRRQPADVSAALPAALPAAKHIFTHIEWLMSGVQLRVPAQSAPAGYVWASRAALRTTYTLPGAFRAYKPLLL